MARDGAVVGSFHRGNGRLAALDAVEEIPVMALGLVKTGFDDVIAKFRGLGSFDDFIALALLDDLLQVRIG